MREYLGFDKLITPALVRVLFWLLLIGVLLIALTDMFGGHFWLGLLLLLVGPIGVRIYCEVIIVVFQISNTLTEIRDEQRLAAERSSAPLASTPPVT